MRILVLYATTEGQTRRIARFAADRLADRGHAVELLNADDAGELDLARFDAAILAGSLHVGGYQAALAAAATRHADALNARPTLFLPVSLSAAGDDPEDWVGLEAATRRFLDRAGWRPGRITHVAGAFRFTQYDFFRSWAMRWIAHRRGEAVDPHADREYTDWAALAAALDDWAAQAAAGPGAPPT